MTILEKSQHTNKLRVQITAEHKLKSVSVDPCNDPLWHQLVRQKESDVFESPEWINVIANTYGFNILAQVLVDGSNQPVAGIQYCIIEDMRGKRIASFPFSDYCDPFVENLEQWKLISGSIIQEDAPYNIRILHNDILLGDKRLKHVNRAKWHGIDLELDLEELWNGLDGSARRAIRKAQKEDLRVQITDRKEDVRKFFELHLGVRKYKYHLVAQPYSFFENIWEQFFTKGNGFLILAEHKGEFIGGVFFLVWQNKLYYKFNASNPEYLSLRPNDLVIWEAIQLGKQKGLKLFDFGISDWDQEGLVRYKRKYATEEKTVSFLRYTPNGWEPSAQASQIGALFPKLTDLFTDETVPDHVTEKAGEVLYRFFC